MSSFTRYLIPCLTENANITTDYRNTFPTVCPNNNTHTINAESIITLDSIEHNTVTIDQSSDVKTGNFYRADYYEIPINQGTGTITNFDLKYPYNISTYGFTLFPLQENIGDKYNVNSMPDTNIGVISSPIDIGATSLICENAMYLNPGFYLYITDGINKNNLGYIISIDNTTCTINFSNSTINSFDTGSLLQFTVPRVTNGKIINIQNIELGSKPIGSSGLPANKIIRLEYLNVDGNPKTFNFNIEFQY